MKDLQLDMQPRTGGDITQYIPSSLSLATERTSQPATLTGEIPVLDGKIPEIGSVVRLTVDGQHIFYGYLFSLTVNRYGILTFTAYDQLRYLKGNYTGYFKTGCEPKDIINEIAMFYSLKVGELATTGYTARRLMVEDECCLDAIQKQIDLATIKTKKVWTFYDDNGALTLKSAEDMVADVYLSTDNFCTDYELTIDIDSDTYNAVALYRPSSSKLGRRLVTAPPQGEQNENMQKWGVLFLYESADEDMNSNQMEERAKNMLALKNRPVKTLRIVARGVVGLRAGMMVTLNFPDLPTISRRQQVVLDSVTHDFTDSDHTMQLETKTLWMDS